MLLATVLALKRTLQQSTLMSRSSPMTESIEMLWLALVVTTILASVSRSGEQPEQPDNVHLRHQRPAKMHSKPYPGRFEKTQMSTNLKILVASRWLNKSHRQPNPNLLRWMPTRWLWKSLCYFIGEIPACGRPFHRQYIAIQPNISD